MTARPTGQVVRQLGRDGWLALSWPQEYGGRGGTMLDQLIFTDEAAIARVPVPFLTINTVGPTIMRFGTAGAEGVLPAADRRGRDPLLDRVLRAGGRHRPGLAAHHGGPGRRRVRDRRPEDVDQPDPVRRLRLAGLPDRSRAPRHKGLSIIIVPTSAEGFSWTPVRTVAGVTTSATYYSVGPGAGHRAGGRGEPGLAADHQPAQPRAGGADLGGAGAVGAGRGAGLGGVGQAGQTGERVIDAEWVRLNLARVHAKAEFLKLVNWRIASAGGAVGPAAASATKVFGTEFAVEAYRLLMEVLGANAQVAFGLGRGGAGRPDRADAPRRADPDLRRRHERGPARHHRGRRARAAPSP